MEAKVVSLENIIQDKCNVLVEIVNIIEKKMEETNTNYLNDEK